MAGKLSLQVVGGLVAVAVTAVGCGSSNSPSASGSSQPVKGGTAVVALPVQTSPNWFFPLVSLTADSVVNYQVDEMMYKPLLRISRHDKINWSRSLASSVTWNPQGTQYTIHLKKKWHWSNGHPVSAKDIVFTWDIMRAASQTKATLPWYYSGAGFGGLPNLWHSVVATGPRTVVVTLNAPKNQQWFLRNGINQIIPIPQSVWDKYPHNMHQELSFIHSVANSPSAPQYNVVDGPYHLQKAVANQDWVFVPNSHYDGKPSTLSKVVFQYETSSTAEFSALKTGQVNVGYLPVSLLPARHQLSQDVFSTAYPLGFNYIVENFSSKAPGGIGRAFQHLYVRQAMQMGVNQPGIIRSFYGGHGVVDTGPLAPKPHTALFDSSLSKNPYPFNPTAGKKLLEQHGWHLSHGVMTKNGITLSFTMDYASGSHTATNVVELLKHDWAKEGIQVALSSQPFNTIISNSQANASKWAMIDWNGGWTYGTDPYPTGGGLFGTGGAENSGGFSASSLDKLIAATYQPGSATQSLQRLYAYEAWVAHNLPAVFIPWTPLFNEHSVRLHGTVRNFDPVGDVISPNYWYFTK